MTEVIRGLAQDYLSELAILMKACVSELCAVCGSRSQDNEQYVTERPWSDKAFSFRVAWEPLAIRIAMDRTVQDDTVFTAYKWFGVAYKEVRELSASLDRAGDRTDLEEIIVVEKGFAVIQVCSLDVNLVLLQLNLILRATIRIADRRYLLTESVAIS